MSGVNLLGYSRSEMGIGESCRIAANTLSHSQIPFGIINFKGMNNARATDLTWISKEMKEPIYNVNIFHVNADQMVDLYSLHGQSLFSNRYNIGFWHWELPDFPDEWLRSFRLLDEIWVPSYFVQDSISIKSPIPVIRIPHSIEVKMIEKRNRTYYGLPDNIFLFLTMYDVNSYQERKNPKASIEAFKNAFGFDNMAVGLVIKINNSKSNKEEMEVLRRLVSDFSNIYLINETMGRSDVNALIDCCDCFVSLHRSEGFGLGLAEAMYLGKVVIGTKWSSNTDFMNEDNSCLVDYKLIPVGKDIGPYKSHQYWADPDIEHASHFMKKLVEDKEFCERLSKNGEKDIKKNHSPERIAELVSKRLKNIELWKFGG